MGTSFVAFIIVLGVLIFVHELGHFLVARFFGVGVEKFSLGFGPRIFGRKVGMTDYRLSAIPLGGYVKMVGDEPDSELEPWQIPYSFTHKPVSQRFLIVAAGPLFNLLLALVQNLREEIETVWPGHGVTAGETAPPNRLVACEGEVFRPHDEQAGEHAEVGGQAGVEVA